MNDNKNSESNSQRDLFKSTYKFIDFKKESNFKTNHNNRDDYDDGTRSEEIKQFYQQLISTPTEATEATTSKEIAIPKLKQTFNNNQLLNIKQFFLAAQNNELNKIRNHFKSANSTHLILLESDSFKWNALMISIASFSNECVEYLLNYSLKCSNETTKKMLEMCDESGLDSEQIAIKIKNKKAIELIEYTKQKIDNNDLNKLQQNDEKEVYLCEPSKNKVSSIINILNETENNKDKKQKVLSNYHLR
jgi:hypothetical protein